MVDCNDCLMAQKRPTGEAADMELGEEEEGEGEVETEVKVTGVGNSQRGHREEELEGTKKGEHKQRTSFATDARPSKFGPGPGNARRVLDPKQREDGVCHAYV